MWIEIVDTILLFRYFILLSVAVLLVCSFLSLLFCHGLYIGSMKMRFYGLFFDNNPRRLFRLSIAVIWLLFVVSCAIFPIKRDVVFVVFLLVLCALFHLPQLRPLDFLFDILNNSVIYGSLVAQDVLMTYLRDVKLEPTVLVIYLLLVLFTIQYAIFFFIKMISASLRSVQEKNNHNSKHLRKQLDMEDTQYGKGNAHEYNHPK